jgi:hypothetical protein
VLLAFGAAGSARSAIVARSRALALSLEAEQLGDLGVSTSCFLFRA